MYKTSKYNFIIPVNEKEVYLLYNSLYNGLYEATWSEGELIKGMEKKENISMEEFESIETEFRELLLSGGFILEHHMEEKEIIDKRKEAVLKNAYNSGEFVLTIAPTNSCNMACSYCYEGEDKPISGGMSELTLDQIMEFLEKEVKNKKFVKEFKKLSIQWYGGEPLLSFKNIEKLSKRLIHFAEKNSLEYDADMVTNGSLMTPAIWQKLLEYKITNVQITIDGYKITHDENRPLKGKNKNSYHTILENLAKKPEDIFVNIRVNADKKVVKYLDRFLIDLEKYKIWPYNSKTVQLQLARKEHYKNTNFNETELLLTQEEFFNEYDQFQLSKFNFYNEWIKEHPHRKKAKRAFYYPDITTYICKVAHYPYGLTIDQYGNIFKCWEYLNNSEKNIQHISNDYNEIANKVRFSEMVNFNKVDECSDCKFLPICEVNCVARYIDPDRDKQHCEWKFLLEKRFVYQYNLSVDYPDKIHAFKKIKDVRKEMTEANK